MFFLFVQCISVENLGISFGKCHFYYIYLFVAKALIYFVWCSVFGRLLLFACPETFL
jgi:hypothetical protein